LSADGPATLLLVRHGQIAANVSRVWHGSTDSELTERGLEEARRTADHLASARNVRALYSSPLLRTRQTAEAIAARLGLVPRLEPGLAEYGIGELEGVSYADLLNVHGFFARIRSDRDFAPPGGESPRQVLERAIGALHRIARTHRGEEVVIVSHGAALGLALGELLHGDPDRWMELHLSNCAVSELVLEPAPRLLAWNRTDHL
jgi:broad specificity phosphatase PhoE